MSSARRAALAVAAAGALALAVPAIDALDRSPAAAPASDDALSDALSTAQGELSERALSSLAARTCTTAPATVVLAGLPDDALACLGTGPRRAPSAGDGRPTVVNLWASWCPPCVDELPVLQSAADAARPGVRFVGVDVEDDRASAAGLLDATGVRYESYEDPDATVRAAVGAVGLPVTLVFDARGREVARKMGAVDREWLDDALSRATR